VWAPVASAQISIWSAAGATGAIDESGLSMYVFGSNGAVAIRSSVDRGTLTVRYPVGVLQFTPQPGDCPEIRANVRDTGPGARVIVRLMRLSMNGFTGPVGELTSIAEIDSDTVPPSGAPNQFRSFRACLNGDPDPITDFTYYVDVQLIKTAATASPGLLSLQICPSQDFCDP
jgi:hypothetical protein